MLVKEVIVPLKVCGPETIDTESGNEIPDGPRLPVSYGLALFWSARRRRRLCAAYRALTRKG